MTGTINLSLLLLTSEQINCFVKPVVGGQYEIHYLVDQLFSSNFFEFADALLQNAVRTLKKYEAELLLSGVLRFLAHSWSRLVIHSVWSPSCYYLSFHEWYLLRQ